MYVCMYMTTWNADADADDYDDAVDGLLQTTSCLGSECERMLENKWDRHDEYVYDMSNIHIMLRSELCWNESERYESK